MVLFIILALLLLVEVLTVFALRAIAKQSNQSNKKIAWGIYWGWTLFVFGCVFYYLIFREKFSIPKNMHVAYTIVGFWFMNFALKATVSGAFTLNQMTNFFANKLISKKDTQQKSRRQFITKTGLALASIPFSGLLYGMIKGRYQFKIWKQELVLENLPKSFVGKKIIHLSDMHLGSFPQKTKAVAAAVEKINELKPDYIFFTGDMVNERAIEVKSWISTLKKLEAKSGKYASLGNHDYGDYYEPWDNQPEKIEENVQQLAAFQKEMGFQLLRNENILLKQGKESIRLIGLENWGAGRFSKYGDLQKAMAGSNDNEVQILLSHDPSHWDEQVLGKTTIDLALAGHTHGSQIGVEIPGFRWSPVKYRYPRWAGLYKEGKQQLYVNRGFGYIGYAGRVGIWPEITVFTLSKK